MGAFERQHARLLASNEQIDTRCVEILFEYEVDVNSYSEIGETALFLAASDGLIQLCELLLNKGADMYYRDKVGAT